MLPAQFIDNLKSNFRVQSIADRISYLLILSLVLQLVSPLILIQKAHAATLTQASVQLYRMSASNVASASDPILVVVTPTSTATEGKFKITFPTTNGFTVDGTASNITSTTTGIPSTYQGTSLNAWPSIGSAATGVSGGAVTFASGDLTAGTEYGFFITGGITNPTNAHAGTFVISMETETSGAAAIDSSTAAVDVTSTNADQVTLYATVSATFNFALSANTISMGALSPSARATGSITADVDTNANNGWIAWMKSAGDGTLASSTTGDSISSTNTGSCVTATIGSKGYVVDVNAAAGTGGGGSLTVATEYDCTDNQAGGVISTAYEQIAQRTGPVDSDTLTLNGVVTISPTTKAATDYTDTWDVVGAGNF